MTPASAQRLVSLLLQEHGQTYAEELGIRLGNTPAPLFQLLCAALLFSARIGAAHASTAARALFAQGWRSATTMHRSTWQQRVQVLNQHGYARYDESSARMLGDTCTLLLDHYKGDLRRLRAAAGQDPQREHKLLQQFKGIGPVGADIFCREAQLVWPELYPFVDAKAQQSAKALGLPSDPGALAELTSQDQFPHLLAGLIRVKLTGQLAQLRQAA